MNQTEFDRTMTLIKRQTYDGNLDKAINLMLNLIEKQQECINELNKDLEHRKAQQQHELDIFSAKLRGLANETTMLDCMTSYQNTSKDT